MSKRPIAQENEAAAIEMESRERAEEFGGISADWRDFVTPSQRRRLVILAEVHGVGTWASEPETLARMKGVGG